MSDDGDGDERTSSIRRPFPFISSRTNRTIRELSASILPSSTKRRSASTPPNAKRSHQRPATRRHRASSCSIRCMNCHVPSLSFSLSFSIFFSFSLPVHSIREKLGHDLGRALERDGVSRGGGLEGHGGGDEEGRERKRILVFARAKKKKRRMKKPFIFSSSSLHSFPFFPPLRTSAPPSDLLLNNAMPPPKGAAAAAAAAAAATSDPRRRWLASRVRERERQRKRKSCWSRSSSVFFVFPFLSTFSSSTSSTRSPFPALRRLLPAARRGHRGHRALLVRGRRLLRRKEGQWSWSWRRKREPERRRRQQLRVARVVLPASDFFDDRGALPLRPLGEIIRFSSFLELARVDHRALLTGKKRGKKTENHCDVDLAARRPRRSRARAEAAAAGLHRRPPRRARAAVCLREEGEHDDRGDETQRQATATRPRRSLAGAPFDPDDDGQERCRWSRSLSDAQHHRHQRVELFFSSSSCCCSPFFLLLHPGCLGRRRGVARHQSPRRGRRWRWWRCWRSRAEAAERFRFRSLFSCFLLSGRPPGDRSWRSSSPQGLARWRWRRWQQHQRLLFLFLLLSHHHRHNFDPPPPFGRRRSARAARRRADRLHRHQARGPGAPGKGHRWRQRKRGHGFGLRLGDAAQAQRRRRRRWHFVFLGLSLRERCWSFQFSYGRPGSRPRSSLDLGLGREARRCSLGRSLGASASSARGAAVVRCCFCWIFFLLFLFLLSPTGAPLALDRSVMVARQVGDALLGRGGGGRASRRRGPRPRRRARAGGQGSPRRPPRGRGSGGGRRRGLRRVPVDSSEVAACRGFHGRVRQRAQARGPGLRRRDSAGAGFQVQKQQRFWFCCCCCCCHLFFFLLRGAHLPRRGPSRLCSGRGRRVRGFEGAGEGAAEEKEEQQAKDFFFELFFFFFDLQQQHQQQLRLAVVCSGEAHGARAELGRGLGRGLLRGDAVRKKRTSFVFGFFAFALLYLSLPSSLFSFFIQTPTAPPSPAPLPPLPPQHQSHLLLPFLLLLPLLS